MTGYVIWEAGVMQGRSHCFAGTLSLPACAEDGPDELRILSLSARKTTGRRSQRH